MTNGITTEGFDYETLAELETAKASLNSQVDYFDELTVMSNCVLPSVLPNQHRVMGALGTLLTQNLPKIVRELSAAVAGAAEALETHRDELEELFMQGQSALTAGETAAVLTAQLRELNNSRGAGEAVLNTALADCAEAVSKCVSDLQQLSWEPVTVTPVSQRVPLWENRQLSELYWQIRNSSGEEAAALIAENSDIYEKLVRDYPLLACQLTSLPTAEQNRVNRKALKWATKNPEEAYVAMGFNETTLGTDEFKKQLRILKKQLHKADENYAELLIAGAGIGVAAQALNRENSQNRVNLSGFGRHDGAITAQVSFGDPQTAEHMALIVPGMYSTVAGTGEINTAALNLMGESLKYTNSVAISVWIGYDSPTATEEPFMKRATAGGMRLSQGINEVQRLRSNNPPKTFAVIGHSFGTTTGAEGIKRLNTPVDIFIAVGSAGLKTGTTADSLKTRRIAATSADPLPANWGILGEVMTNPLMPNAPLNYLTYALLASDYIAPIGRTLGEHRVDPRDLKGAEVFSSNRLLQDSHFVGTHSMISTDNDLVKGYFQENTQSLEWIAKEITRGGESEE